MTRDQDKARLGEEGGGKRKKEQLAATFPRVARRTGKENKTDLGVLSPSQ